MLWPKFVLKKIDVVSKKKVTVIENVFTNLC